MKKIPTLFQRSEDRRSVVPTITPGCEWVQFGEGQATRKYDGTCIAFRNGEWFARREVKAGKEPPPDFEQEDIDEITGNRMGWEPAKQSGFARFLDEALQAERHYLTAGTYELCGPKINGNPEGVDRHRLIRHDEAEIVDAPRSYDGLRTWLLDHTIEGIVWHHSDGRMAKLKRRDFR